MKKDLKENWNIDAVVVYDKPNMAVFGDISLEQKHSLFKKLDLTPEDSENQNETLFTVKEDSQVTWKQERPMLLVSSTSWTKDEVDYSCVIK